MFLVRTFRIRFSKTPFGTKIAELANLLENENKIIITYKTNYLNKKLYRIKFKC